MFLGVAKQCGASVEHSIARRLRSVAAGLIGTVLACVENMEGRQASVSDATVEPHRAALRAGRRSDRHVLVVGLVGVSAPRKKIVDHDVGLF